MIDSVNCKYCPIKEYCGERFRYNKYAILTNGELDKADLYKCPLIITIGLTIDIGK
jgi:MoaA/NifB/PqqE/SkfB family radical SAM enzyme